jgi:hypothetical protein
LPRFWEIASLPSGFLTPFSIRSSRRLRNSLRSDILADQKRGQSPFLLALEERIPKAKSATLEKRGLSPFLLALEERIPKAKSAMVAAAISQNLLIVDLPLRSDKIVLP